MRVKIALIIAGLLLCLSIATASFAAGNGWRVVELKAGQNLIVCSDGELTFVEWALPDVRVICTPTQEK